MNKKILFAAAALFVTSAYATDIQICYATTRGPVCHMVPALTCPAGQSVQPIYNYAGEQIATYCGTQPECLDLFFQNARCNPVSRPQPITSPPNPPAQQPVKCTIAFSWTKGAPHDVHATEFTPQCDNNEANIATLHMLGELLGDQ